MALARHKREKSTKTKADVHSFRRPAISLSDVFWNIRSLMSYKDYRNLGSSMLPHRGHIKTLPFSAQLA